MAPKPVTLDSFTRTLLGQTVLALTLIDAALYLDMTLRWENGFGFVRAAWLWPSLGFIAGALVLNLWLVKRGASGWFQGVLAFVGLSYAFFLASSGSPHYAWKEVPFMFHVLSTKDSLIERLILEGGFAGALAGAFGHLLLGRSAASALHHPAPWVRERWVFALSMALLGAATVWRLDAVDLRRDLLDASGGAVFADPRASSPATLQALSIVRGVFWGAVALSGLVLLLAALRSTRRRELWLERVRKGEVDGYRVVELGDHSKLSLARYSPGPKSGFRHVLAKIERGDEIPIAFVP